MKTLHNPVIIGVISSVIIGGVIFVMFQTIISGPVTMPSHNWKVYPVTNFEELNTTEMTIKNQTYYFDALNDTTTVYHHDPVQISFHGVIFTLFPWPYSGGPPGSCGGNGFGADAKFPDDIHELITIFVASQPCLGDSTPTSLSTHANPQAGLIFYDGKIRLLVSTENESQQNVANISNLIPVTNTNFTINYNITGDNKLLDARLDSKTKTLELSLQTPSNGTLTVTVPRALLDAKTNDNQDNMFILLIDGQETNYMQTTSSLDRTLIIPFDQGATKIEIIATQLI